MLSVSGEGCDIALLAEQEGHDVLTRAGGAYAALVRSQAQGSGQGMADPVPDESQAAALTSEGPGSPR